MERGREMIGLSYRSSTREGCACRGRTPSASVPPSDATSASLPFRTPPSLVQHNEIRRNVAEMCAIRFLKSSVSSCLRALRVDRPEARGCPTASRAEAARVHCVPRVYVGHRVPSVWTGRYVPRVRADAINCVPPGRRVAVGGRWEREGRNLLRPWWDSGDDKLMVGGRMRAL